MASSTSTHTSATDELRQLLASTLRISVADGRVFIGSFIGTDQPMNILLADTEEIRIEGSKTGHNSLSPGRFVGQVLIPWKIIQKIEVHEPVQPERRTGTQVDFDGYVM